MLRFLFIILALAAYGAYSLISGFWESDPVPVPVGVQETSKGFGFNLDGAKEMAVTAAAKSTGFEFSELPANGCSGSILEPQKVESLVLSLQEPQRSALASVLNASSVVWAAQLYTGARGVGLCLPASNRLVLFPSGASSMWDKAGDLIGSIASKGMFE